MIINTPPVPLPANKGGTGFNSYTTGDMLYASSTTAFSKLSIGTAGRVMQSTGSAPVWNADIVGVSGGRTIYGGTGSTENLTIRANSNGSSGVINLGNAPVMVISETNDSIAIGTSTLSTVKFRISSSPTTNNTHRTVDIQTTPAFTTGSTITFPQRGMILNHAITGTDAVSGVISTIDLTVKPTKSSGTSTEARGIKIYAANGGTAAITTLTGLDVEWFTDDTGGGTTVNAIKISAPTITTSGVFTTSYGLNITNQGVSGATTNYGAYIAAQTGATTNYGIYVDGSSTNNVIAGTLQVGARQGIGQAATSTDALGITFAPANGTTPRGITVSVAPSFTGSTSTTIFGIDTELALASAQNHTGSTGAVRGILRYTGSSNTLTSGVGLISAAIHNGAGTVTSLRGVASQIHITSTGGGTSASAVIAQTPISTGSGTFTNGHGIYVADQSVARYTTSYGILIENQGSSAGTTYAFASEGSDDVSFFAGSLMIGASSAASTGKLEVRSTTTQQRLSYDGSNRLDTAVSSSGSTTWTQNGTTFTMVVGTSTTVFTITSSLMTLASGVSLTITSGTFTITSGSAVLTSGNLTLTSGNLTLSNGVGSILGTSSSSSTITPMMVFMGAAASIDDPLVNFGFGHRATTDGTANLNMCQIQLPTDCVYWLDLIVIARRTSGSGSAGDRAVYRFTTTGTVSSGTVAFDGSTATPVAVESVGGWDCNLANANTGILRVRITGAASTNITWHGYARWGYLNA